MESRSIAIVTAVIVSVLIVLGISFFIYNIPSSSLTGFVVYGNESQNGTVIPQAVATQQDAINAINESEAILKEMQDNNLTTTYINDSLVAAKVVFEQARYAEILRGNSSEAEKQIATQALRLVNWKSISYNDVLVYTEDIKKSRDAAFLLLDELTIQSANTAGLSNQTILLLDQAKTAFYDERYNDSEKLIEDFKLAAEQEKAQALTLSGIRKGTMNFFQRYWPHIIIVVILLTVIGFINYRKYKRRFLANKINKMKAEIKVLHELMKKAQEERFKENKISGLVYNIRMGKYESRLQEIKEELPALEKRLSQQK